MKTEEIEYLLLNPDILEEIGIEILDFPVQTPLAGSLLCYSFKTKWRKDGHEWMTRNLSNHVRED